MRRVAIAGGGISGLCAALCLTDLARERNQPLHLTIFDPAEQLGGCIQTRRDGELIMELGPDSLLAKKPAAAQLLRRLRLDDRIQPMLAHYTGACVVRAGTLRRLPAGFRLFAPASLPAIARSGIFSTRGMLRAAMEPFIPARHSTADESLASFVTRRFGREVFERLAQPLVGGIYSGDPQRLSMQATLPHFADLERKHGSLLRAMRVIGAAPAPQLMSLQGGLATIIEAIEHELQGVEHVRRSITELRELRGAYDGVICALPAHAAAQLVRDTDPPLAELLDHIRCNSIATVNLAYDAAAVPRLPRTTGFVVPFVERRRVTAATIVTQKYSHRAPSDTVLLRTFIGGALQPELLVLDDGDLARMAHEELRALLGVNDAPRLAVVSRWDRNLPEYGLGHGDRVNAIEARAAALGCFALAGSAYRGVGIPDCIASGYSAAQQIAGILGI